MTAGDLLGLFGRLHPMVLHLPIGLLVALGAVEIVSFFADRDAIRPVRLTLAILTALAAVVAIGTGFVLSREDGYGGTTVDLHLWLGILLAIVCVSVAVQAVRAARHQHRALGLYRLGLVAALALMFPVGHLGASMTHGEDFLLAPIHARARAATAGGGGAGALLDEDPSCVLRLPVFATRVQPILEEHCAVCHGPSRQKGGLALHDAAAVHAAMTAGGSVDGSGEDPAIVVAGSPEHSELVRRLQLPLDDDDHMPPPGRPQPTAEEIAVIVQWIADGASFEAMDGGDQTPGAEAGASVVAAIDREPRNAAPNGPELVAPAKPEAVRALHQALVHAEPLHVGSPLLAIDGAGAASSIDDAAAERLLGPVVAQVADLSLARSAVTDQAVDVIGRMQQLVRLDLGNTAITDAALDPLSSLPRLAELVLVRTELTDGAVDRLATMPALERVFLWDAGISPEAVARLRAARPGLVVDAGDAAEAAAIETEPAVKVGGPAPAAEGPNGTAVALTPVNTTCPVTGAPVDPRYLVVHEGRVIGFCCPNCPKAFWDDPARFKDKLP
ncbi:MAG: hypothetical protein KDA22_04970 [Phycisphaerales bacterium]|nr:hypothetical protein [Phycisphaerales bacterium]